MQLFSVSRHVSSSRRIGLLVGALATAATASLVVGGSAAALPPISGDHFNPIMPSRLLDTRASSDNNVTETIDGLEHGEGLVGAGEVIEVQMTGRVGIPDDAAAVAINLTGTKATKRTFITAWPTGESMPNASNLNLEAGATNANMAIVPIGENGTISLFNDSGDVHLIADVAGWFPTGETYQAMNPARLMDTRGESSTIDGQFSGDGRFEVDPGQSLVRNLTIAGRGGVPAAGQVGSVVLNVTVTKASGAGGFVTVFPTGGDVPNASNINFKAFDTKANMVMVPVGDLGQISIAVANASTHVVVDILGWFPPNSSFVGMTPDRVYDSRDPNASEYIPAENIDNSLGSSRPIDLVGRVDLPALEEVGAIVLNITIVKPTAGKYGAYVTVAPCWDQPNLYTSNVNFVTGVTSSNLVIVPPECGYSMIGAAQSSGHDHMVVDVLGYFTAAPLNPL